MLNLWPRKWYPGTQMLGPQDLFEGPKYLGCGRTKEVIPRLQQPNHKVVVKTVVCRMGQKDCKVFANRKWSSQEAYSPGPHPPKGDYQKAKSGGGGGGGGRIAPEQLEVFLP